MQQLNAPNHQLIEATEKYITQLRIENWLNHDLFAWQWWLILTVLILPWFIWWRYVDKKHLLEISLFGAAVLIIVSYLDAVMTELGLWSYRYWVVPLWPRLISVDFTVIPITYMLVYQYFTGWKRFITAMIVVSALYSFAGEPFLTWINIYELHGWKHFYSLPIYLVIGILIKWLVKTLTAVQASRRKSV